MIIKWKSKPDGVYEGRVVGQLLFRLYWEARQSRNRDRWVLQPLDNGEPRPYNYEGSLNEMMQTAEDSVPTLLQLAALKEET